MLSAHSLRRKVSMWLQLVAFKVTPSGLIWA